MAGWRLARSLEVLRRQVDERSPRRRKTSDGTIGDRRHRGRVSDHNAVRIGRESIVLAWDCSHDPGNGCDTWALGERLRASKDPRISYVISNRRIFSSTRFPWSWRRYTGSNPHIQHLHISARRGRHDERGNWDLTGWGRISGSEAAALDADDPTIRRVLRLGMTGEDVKTVQRLLMLREDGIYGVETKRSVEAFQREEGLKADGIIGPLSWGRLDTIEMLPVPLEFEEPRLLSEPE